MQSLVFWSFRLSVSQNVYLYNFEYVLNMVIDIEGIIIFVSSFHILWFLFMS